jgi:hypothetical protein
MNIKVGITSNRYGHWEIAPVSCKYSGALYIQADWQQLDFEADLTHPLTKSQHSDLEAGWPVVKYIDLEYWETWLVVLTNAEESRLAEARKEQAEQEGLYRLIKKLHLTGMV